MQPANQEEQPAPTSVQAKIENEELEEVLISMVNDCIMVVTSVTNVTDNATPPDPTVTNVTVQDTIRAT